ERRDRGVGAAPSGGPHGLPRGDRRAEGNRPALEERGLRGGRGVDRAGIVTPKESSGPRAKPDSLRRSAGRRLQLHGAKEGARGGTTGSPTLEGGDEWIGRGPDRSRRPSRPPAARRR